MLLPTNLSRVCYFSRRGILARNHGASMDCLALAEQVRMPLSHRLFCAKPLQGTCWRRCFILNAYDLPTKSGEQNLFYFYFQKDVWVAIWKKTYPVDTSAGSWMVRLQPKVPMGVPKEYSKTWPVAWTLTLVIDKSLESRTWNTDVTKRNNY